MIEPLFNSPTHKASYTFVSIPVETRHRIYRHLGTVLEVIVVLRCGAKEAVSNRLPYTTKIKINIKKNGKNTARSEGDSIDELSCGQSNGKKRRGKELYFLGTCQLNNFLKTHHLTAKMKTSGQNGVDKQGFG